MMPGLPKKRIETPSVQEPTTDSRTAELEDDLISARERLAILENQNHSLQKSLDLMISESLRLARALSESETTLDKARTQIDHIRIVLSGAKAERRIQTEKIDARNERPELLPNGLAAKEQQVLEICSKPIGNSAETLLASTIEF
jgi:chromosome segregation ATPase